MFFSNAIVKAWSHPSPGIRVFADIPLKITIFDAFRYHCFSTVRWKTSDYTHDDAAFIIVSRVEPCVR